MGSLLVRIFCGSYDPHPHGASCSSRHQRQPRSDITLPIKPVTALANRVTADAQRGIADAHAMLAKRRKVAPAPWRADGFEAQAWACTFLASPAIPFCSNLVADDAPSGDSGTNPWDVTKTKSTHRDNSVISA